MRRLQLLVVLALLAGESHAQSALTCEQQIATQYRGFVTDKLLPEGSGAWLPQLLAISTQMRIKTTQYDVKKQQAEAAESTVAQLLEHLRQAQHREVTLRQELDGLKNGSSTPPTPEGK